MFIRQVLATLIGLVIFSIFSVIVLYSTIAVITMTKDAGVDIEDGSILYLKIDRPITERTMESPLVELDLIGGGAAGVGLDELSRSVARAANDDRIEGIYLEPKFLYSGLSKLKELRDVLEKFKETGKFIVAFGEYYTESEYYLASVADEVYLPEEGLMEFNGFRAEYNFLKGTLDKIGVETQVFRVGAYKSAVEPFTRTEMSAEAREQLESILSSIYATYIEDIARTREVNQPKLKLVADSMLATSATDAQYYDLITKTSYLDQVKDNLREKLGLEDDDKLKMIKHQTYLNSTDPIYSGRERVAVVFADGEIMNGKGDRETIGSESMVKLLSKLRKDKKVKALVLRVNSPGGSSLASDVIWRELKLTAESKPVIASMSDLSASGGYYIAMACDSIIAQPMTITGSIGIYSMYFNAQELLEQKLGITTDVVKTGPLSDVFSVTRPLTDYEKSLFQKSVDQGYETFITKAADARGMDPDELENIAAGRIWSGTQAKENGLVDGIGGLNEAILLAARASGVEDDFKVVRYPTPKSFWEQLLSDLGAEVEDSSLKARLGDLYPYIKKIKQLHRYRGLQARLPFDITIQ